jgi:hypothetical protein
MAKKKPIQLSEAQISLAQKLGISTEEYVRQLAKGRKCHG